MADQLMRRATSHRQSITHRAVLAVIALVAMACTAEPVASGDSSARPTADATIEPAADAAQPRCRPGTPPSAAPHARTTDTGGDERDRIAYAVVGRYDDAFGPIGTQLWSMDPDHGDAVMLLDCDAIRPQWSPDGSRLAFTLGLDDGSWHVATIAADGSDLRILTSGPGVHEVPSWSPDGSWLAYDSSALPLDDPAFRTTLRRIDADGTDDAPLGNPATFDTEPRISPSGDDVVFTRWHPERDWASELVIRNIPTGDERTVVPIGIAVEHPEWSPDGRTLVFNASDSAADAGTIYTLDVDIIGTRPEALLDPTSGDGWGGVKPIFSRDGTHIAFVCFGDDSPDDAICAMDRDGTNVHVVVDEPGVNENHPAWGGAAP